MGGDHVLRSSTSGTRSTVLHMSTDSTSSTPGKTLNVRVSDAELELWKQAAWIRRTSLSEWVRKVLTATAEQTKKEET